VGLIPDELKTRQFRCPKCGQYINTDSDTCRYCSALLTDEDRNAALGIEREERRVASLATRRNTLIMGSMLLIGGIGNALAPVFDFNLFYGQTRVPCLSTIAILLGIVISLFGLAGYLRERNQPNV